MLARRIALAIALIAGLMGTQAPEFAQQYRQRIGGALDELKRIVAEFEAETARQHLTPAQGVSQLEIKQRSVGAPARRGHRAHDQSRRQARGTARGDGRRWPADAPLCDGQGFRSPDRAKHARQLRTRRAFVARGVDRRRPRGGLGLGGDPFVRLAASPPFDRFERAGRSAALARRRLTTRLLGRTWTGTFEANDGLKHVEPEGGAEQCSHGRDKPP